VEENMKTLKNKEGSVLLILVFIVVIISLLGLTAAALSVNELKMASAQRDAVKALYASEGGIERALVDLKQHPFLWDSYWQGVAGREQSLGDGAYILELNSLGSGLIEVISTGRVRKAKKIIKAVVRVSTVNPVFEYALFCDNSFTAEGFFSAEGNIHINGSVDAEGHRGVIRGNLHYTGELIHGDDLNITGGVFTSEKIVLPVPDKTFYREMALNEGELIEGSVFWEQGKSINGFVYITGSLKASRFISGSGVIFAEGDIELTGDVLGSDNSPIVIIAEGNIEIKGEHDITGIIYSRSKFSISSKTSVRGSLVMREHERNEELQFTVLHRGEMVQKAAAYLPGSGETRVNLLSWEEMGGFY
jgi:hypothetical protein